MRTILAGLLLCACGAVYAMELGPEARQEAKLYTEYAKAVYSELNGEKDQFETYQKLLELAPQSAYLKRQLVALAVVGEDVSRADPYADFLEDSPKDAQDLTIYAAYMWRKGEIAKALKYYEEALEKNPDDTRILYQYVLILTFTDIEKAVEKLNEYKDRYPLLAPAINQEIGNIYYKKKQFDEAINYYNQATKLDPLYEPPYISRADIYEKTSRFFLMLRELELLDAMGYKDADVLSRMASVYVLSGDTAKAKEYFLKAKTLDKGDIPSAYFLAVFAEKEGDFKQAVSWLQTASDYQTDAGKWLQVAFYLQRMGELRQSLDLLKQAHQKFEKNVEISYFYGLSLIDDKQFARAARVLKGVLETNPSYEGARLGYAYALEGQKKYAKMEEQVKVLIEQKPEAAAAFNLLAFSLAERNVRLQEAEQYAAKAVSLKPEEGSYVDTLAWVYYRLGQYQKALDLMKAFEPSEFDKSAELAYHLGAIYAGLGEREKAVFYLQKATGVKTAAKLLKKLQKTK